MDDRRFARIKLMLGEKNHARLRGSFVVVFGLGAVGSYAVEGLARAGVGKLRLVDFDAVQPSNINRQLYALDSTVGRFKCDVAAARVRDINPDCETEPVKDFAASETLHRLLSGEPDLIIDAIDSLGPKAALITETLRRKIPIISSMGAALRTDPALIRTGPFSQVKNCPLAARLRKLLKTSRTGLDFTCVYSLEPVAAAAKQQVPPGGEPQPYERGRRRAALGSLPTLTGIFGLTAANAAIQLLAKRAENAG